MKARRKFVGGGFVAPVIAPPADAFSSSLSAGPLGPNDVKPGTTFEPKSALAPAFSALQRAYWTEMDVEVVKQQEARAAKEAALKRQVEQYEDELMDVEEDGDDEYDAYGIKLPPRPKPKVEPAAQAAAIAAEDTRQPTKMTVQDLFMMYVNKIDNNGSPLGVLDGSQRYVYFAFPPGASGTKLASLLIDMSPLWQVLCSRYGHQSEERVVATQILPSPISASPLAMLLLRDKGRARYTDAISSMVTLSNLYYGIRDLDVTNPGHKKACDAYDIKLNKLVTVRFYAEVDAIVKLVRIPFEHRQEQDGRKYMDGLLRRYGAGCDLFALSKVHVLEWAIMDLLRVPYILRPALMTPRWIPTDAGAVLIDGSFQVLRLNLCRYLRNRNRVLCAKYEDEVETNEKKKASVRIIGQAEDAYMPMNPDLPPIENRLQLLAVYDKTDKAMELIANQCLYGIYNGWIDLHTLREWLMFLSTDDRGSPDGKEFSGPKMVLTEDQEALKAKEEAGDAVPMEVDEDDE